MSDRNDIRDGFGIENNSKIKRLVYTKNVGWIDLGHARGSDITSILPFLLLEMQNSEIPGYFTIKYEQIMSLSRFSTSLANYEIWHIKKGLSKAEKISILLSLMMSVARKFETTQSHWTISWYTDSGFSGEDLVSDLLGFYRAINPAINYFDLLEGISKKDALEIWDTYGAIGSFKNKNFEPLLFPMPPNAAKKPIRGKLPAFLRTIIPYNDWSSNKVVKHKDAKFFFGKNEQKVVANNEFIFKKIS